MQFTIDKQNASVSVDGVTRTDMPLDALPAGVLAVRWFGTYGDVDVVNADTPTIKRKVRVAEYTAYQPILDAFSVPVVTPPQTTEQIIADVTNATQGRLDAFAATRGYDSVNSAAKYQQISDAEIAALPLDQRAAVEKFRTECRYLAVKTAETWAVLYAFMAAVQAGSKPMPTGYADVEPLLPSLEWPL